MRHGVLRALLFSFWLAGAAAKSVSSGLCYLNELMAFAPISSYYIK